MPPKLPKPPKCCSCNSSGMCKSCSCCKNHTSCVDCVPGKHGRCLNLPGRNFRQNERKRSATSKITVTAVNERKEPATASVSATLSDCSGAQHGNVSKLSGTTALNSSSIPSRVSVKKPSGSSAVRPAASNQRTGPLSFLQPSFIPASTPKVSPNLTLSCHHLVHHCLYLVRRCLHLFRHCLHHVRHCSPFQQGRQQRLR